MSALATGAAIAALSLVLAIARRTVERLGDRIAAWLLPDAQQWTFRLAFAVVSLAEWIAPRPLPRYEGPPTDKGPILPVFPRDWHAPAAAREELIADLREGCAVNSPLRMTAPLLRQAAALRIGLIRHDTSLAWGLTLLLVLMVVGRDDGRERRRLRRARRRRS
jgi:hypothetical protein